MARPSAPVIAGATVAALAVLAAVVAGSRVPDVAQDRRSAVVAWAQGEKPAQVECIRVTARDRGGMRGAFGLDGGTGYVSMDICAEVTDGGEIPLPDGLDVLTSQTVSIPDPGHRMKVAQGAAMDSDCRCPHATTPGDCQRRAHYIDGGAEWVSAAGWQGTMQAGDWQGADCVPTPCEEWAGFSSWPEDCRQ